MRAAVVLASLVSLAVPAAAGAATWSAPQDLSSPHLFVDRPQLDVGGDGSALARWAYGDDGRGGVSSASRAPGAGAFGPARALVRAHDVERRSDRIEGLAAYGRSSALLAFTRPAGRPNVTRRIRLGVRFGRTDGTFGERRTIRAAGGSTRTASRIAGVDLAVSASGDAALAWFEDRGTRIDRVYVSLRPAGGRFGAPRRLATGRIRGVAAAVGAAGDVLVAWDARGVLRTRFKPRTRRGFRATDTIRSEEAFNAEMEPVVTPTGRAVLAWSAQFTSEGGGSRAVRFQTAERPAGASRFARADLLDRIPAGTYDGLGRPIEAVVDSNGRVAVAWSGGETTRRIPHTPPERGLYVTRDDAPGQQLSRSGGDVAILSDLAAGSGGRLIAVWDDGLEARNSVVSAAVAPAAGEPFGPPEDASPAGQDARFGHAAFDPVTGRATIVWSNRPQGSGGPVAEIETFAQAAPARSD